METTTDVVASRAYLRSRQQQREREREDLRCQAMRAVRDVAPVVLAAFPRVQRAYVFGSVLRPRAAFRPDSDIDIAIEGTLGAEEYLALWRELDRAIPGWMLEIVELGSDVRFAERVRQTGELIYERPDSNAEG